MEGYSARDVQRLLGVSASVVHSMIRQGHLRPGKGRGGRYRFGFQDLIVLRTARALRAAKIPTRRINRSLQALRKGLPASMPLSGLSITALGDQLVVREGRHRRDSESGQYLLALEVAIEGTELRMIDLREAASQEEDSAHYDSGFELEETDAAGALAAYQRCLAVNKGHVEARINCGRLLHLAGQLAEAERIYREAEASNATLLFNLGVLLEDLGREDEAMKTYRETLELDAQFADAHFNLARLHERAGNARDSLRHLLAYRRLLNSSS